MIAALLGAVSRDLLRAEIGIDLGGNTIVGADAAILREPFDGDGMIPAEAVALVGEIAVSTADRDLELKRRLYAGAGVPSYWVVDAEQRVVHLFDRPEGGEYRGLVLARFGEAIAVPGDAGTGVMGDRAICADGKRQA